MTLLDKLLGGAIIYGLGVITGMYINEKRAEEKYKKIADEEIKSVKDRQKKMMEHMADVKEYREFMLKTIEGETEDDKYFREKYDRREVTAGDSGGSGGSGLDSLSETFSAEEIEKARIEHEKLFGSGKVKKVDYTSYYTQKERQVTQKKIIEEPEIDDDVEFDSPDKPASRIQQLISYDTWLRYTDPSTGYTNLGWYLYRHDGIFCTEENEIVDDDSLFLIEDNEEINKALDTTPSGESIYIFHEASGTCIALVPFDDSYVSYMQNINRKRRTHNKN